MIARYSTDEMSKIWSEENKYQKWLDVEIAACEAMNKLGKIPPQAMANIKLNAKFNPLRIRKIEETTNHDVIAFLTNLAENIGPDSRFVHMGLTSSDVVDTAFSILIKEAGEQIVVRAEELQNAVKETAIKYKDTIMMGRTHGVHAEPLTFGLKLALWYDELTRNIHRIQSSILNVAFGKISGAVGTYAHLDLFVEDYVCKKMELSPAKISNQILQRDRHAEFLSSCAIFGASLEKFATEIRALHKTEFGEAEEGFAVGQKGSSAMPHKKNPISCERICGMSRVLRGNALVGLENIALWHERDISHSSAERIVFPDSTIALDYMLKLFTNVMKNLIVKPENMKRNLESTGGIIFSQQVLLKLVEKGLARDDAYKIIQENALKSSNGGYVPTFIDLCKEDKRITAKISTAELNSCFDYQIYVKNVDLIFKRLF